MARCTPKYSAPKTAILPPPPLADAVRVAKIQCAYADRYSGLLVVSPVSSRVSVA